PFQRTWRTRNQPKKTNGEGSAFVGGSNSGSGSPTHLREQSTATSGSFQHGRQADLSTAPPPPGREAAVVNLPPPAPAEAAWGCLEGSLERVHPCRGEVHSHP